MTIHLTPAEDRNCPCGALISQDDQNALCPKCRSRARWERRANGKRRHGNRATRTTADQER
jgi:hypothetical protein